MKLNPKQRAFAKHYAELKNATQAAVAAGYSEKTAGSQAHDLLKNPEIQKLVNKELEKLAEKTGVTAEKVIQHISAIAFMKLNVKESKHFSKNKLRALEMLGKHFKLFTEVHEHSGKDGGPIVQIILPPNGSEVSPATEPPPPLPALEKKENAD